MKFGSKIFRKGNFNNTIWEYKREYSSSIVRMSQITTVRTSLYIKRKTGKARMIV